MPTSPSINSINLACKNLSCKIVLQSALTERMAYALQEYLRNRVGIYADVESAPDNSSNPGRVNLDGVYFNVVADADELLEQDGVSKLIAAAYVQGQADAGRDLAETYLAETGF